MQFPNQGSNPHPLQWKCGVLTAWPDKGSPERSVSNSLFQDPFKNEIKVVTSCPLRCPGHGTVLPVITWGFTGPGNLEGHCSPTWESKKHVSRVKGKVYLALRDMAYTLLSEWGWGEEYNQSSFKGKTAPCRQSPQDCTGRNEMCPESKVEGSG